MTAVRYDISMSQFHITSFDLLRKAPAPTEWQTLAAEHEVRTVWLVDDRRLSSSYHHPAERTIYVNTRGRDWYRTALDFEVACYTEAVTLWFLHELGHAAHQHSGADSAARALRFGATDRREVQAWHFALALRRGRRTCWQALVDAYAAWYAAYQHRRKDWPDTLAEARAAGWPERAYLGWPSLTTPTKDVMT